MILVEKIASLRKQNEWSQEDLAEKCNVSRQSVSKWESAASAPDLDKILKLSEIFGVSTDYLLKDTLDDTALQYTTPADDTLLRRVTLSEANEYLTFVEKSSRLMSLGVALCILSPTLLIFLAGLSEFYPDRITENTAAAIGLLFLFLLVVIAVPIFIIVGIRTEKYKYITEEPFEPEYGVTGLAGEKLKNHEKTFTLHIAAGVTLCILGVIPLVVSSVLLEESMAVIVFLDLLLLLVTAAVILFIRAGMIQESCKQLLQTEDFTPQEKKLSRQTSPVASIYWCIVVAIYLGISFYTMRWHFTWIIWPVAGVFYGAVDILTRWLLKRNSSDRH